MMVTEETLRKGLIMFGLCISSMSEGYIFGQLTGMIPGLMEDSDLGLSADQVSWIASASMFTATLGFLVAALVSELLGRRHTISILTAPIALHWLILYFARDFHVFMITRSIMGACFGGVMSIIFISTAEYNNPQDRASWLTIITAFGPTLGGIIAQFLSTLLHWREVALIGIVPSALSIILPCFWVESPSWLASKGRFDECEVAFKALHGSGHAALTELQLLVTLEKCKLAKMSNASYASVSICKKLLHAVKQKYFWTIALLSSVLHAFKAACGKVQVNVYIVSILKETVGRADATMMGIHCGSVILGCAVSYFIMRKTNLRPLLFSTGILGNILLTALGISVYLDYKDSIYYPFLNAVLLFSYFFILHAGVYPLMEAVAAEIYPLDIKMYCSFIFGVVGTIMMSLSIKLAPSMFASIGYHGVFILNAAIMSACLVYLWFRLPETKGKTLQEIELHLKNENCEINVTKAGDT